jgi:hypothetical protein
MFLFLIRNIQFRHCVLVLSSQAAWALQAIGVWSEGKVNTPTQLLPSSYMDRTLPA